MQLYPAIDLKDGQCVRLSQGKFKDIMVYSKEPWDIAKKWESQGASYLHLVDLDGALAGNLINGSVIKKIVESIQIPVQIGGGIRSAETIDLLLSFGVARVIIGTKAVENPEFIKSMINKFTADKIVVGVDAKDGMAATNGWETISQITSLELCEQMKGFGVKHIVYTDISKDGMLQGPNISHTELLTKETDLNIIASGGVSSMADLEALYKSGIKGVIIGKALYENRLDLQAAVTRFE